MKQQAYAHSFASFLPSRKVSNDDLSEMMDTSDAWIRKRTGIETRYWAEAPVTTSDLATASAKKSLEEAQGPEVDCIIAATLSPDYNFPGIGVFVQDKLGLKQVPAFDVRNQCSGFLYALEMADAFIQSEKYSQILVIGAEVHSTGLDISTRGRDIAVLFGDGAGSCLVSAKASSTTQSFKLLGSELHSDGAYVEELCCKNPGSAHFPTRLTHEMIEKGDVFPFMNGKVVFEHAIKGMAKVSHSLLQEHDLTPEDVSLFIPHQANQRINQMVASQIGLKAEANVSTISMFGNTTAATIPIGFRYALDEQRVHSGDLVLSAVFGSGFTWGAALFQAV